MLGKHFLTVSDFSSADIERVLATAAELKAKQKAGKSHELLKGKSLAMIFEKPSNRTRVSFEVAMVQLGGHALNIRPEEIQMSVREPIPDVAKVLSRYVDGIMMRAIRHQDIVELAKYSSVPVINGLSDLYHPCQAVADILTIKEKKGSLKGIKLTYIGDGNNVANSLINICKLLGITIVICCPEGYEPDKKLVSGPFEIIRDPNQAVKGADVIYTDVWTSMGQEAESAKRLKDFSGYTVTKALLAKANPGALFMHCLPAHRGEEIEDGVPEHPQSVIFDQAENRLHAQKAILALLMNR